MIVSHLRDSITQTWFGPNWSNPSIYRIYMLIYMCCVYRLQWYFTYLKAIFKNSVLLHKHFLSIDGPPAPHNHRSNKSISGQTPFPPKYAYIILGCSLTIPALKKGWYKEGPEEPSSNTPHDNSSYHTYCFLMVFNLTRVLVDVLGVVCEHSVHASHLLCLITHANLNTTSKIKFEVLRNTNLEVKSSVWILHFCGAEQHQHVALCVCSFCFGCSIYLSKKKF